MKYLGIDYGKKRVGVALSDEGGQFALPKAVLPSDHQLIKKIKELCDLYYKNPLIDYYDILNAHLHSIYLINIDKGFAKELDPQGYVELTERLLQRSEVGY